MLAKILGLLMRSEQVALDRLQDVCNQLAERIQEDFSERLSGKIHILPETRSLEWLEHLPGEVTADIMPVAIFGEKKVTKKIPKLSETTIVIECHLLPIDSAVAFEKARSIAELLIKELIGIMAECELEVRETRITYLPIGPTNSIPASYETLAEN
ncbi:MAG: hypothetical protein ACE5OZ_01220 [Candidatus Heimdallarchaeota archaeon]